jgi:ABC-type polysaccharide/polyol phosphate export permease
MVASRMQRAFSDVFLGLRNVRMWHMLAWQEIRQRYRRSVLGPFWITISTGCLVAGMGPLYSKLLNQPTGEYFTYIAVGLVLWQLMSGLISDCCQAFINAEGFIKQIRLPLSLHVLRVVWRHALMFAHNSLIILLVMVFAPPPLHWSLLTSAAAFVVLLVNALWVGLMLGMVSARFRDIPQFINSLLQVGLFLTPILWKIEMLGEHRWFALINPIYHFMEIIRGPLMGAEVSAMSWAVVGAVTFFGWIITMLAFSRFRARIAFWV